MEGLIQGRELFWKRFGSDLISESAALVQPIVIPGSPENDPDYPNRELNLIPIAVLDIQSETTLNKIIELLRHEYTRSFRSVYSDRMTSPVQLQLQQRIYQRNSFIDPTLIQRYAMQMVGAKQDALLIPEIRYVIGPGVGIELYSSIQIYPLSINQQPEALVRMSSKGNSYSTEGIYLYPNRPGYVKQMRTRTSSCIFYQSLLERVYSRSDRYVGGITIVLFDIQLQTSTIQLVKTYVAQKLDQDIEKHIQHLSSRLITMNTEIAKHGHVQESAIAREVITNVS